MKRVWMVLGTFLLAQAAQGAEVRRSLGAPTIIEDENDVARVLFKLAEPLGLENVAISRASVRIPLAGAQREGALDLRIYAISRDWAAATVDWSRGWTRAGGDVHDDLYSQARLDLAGTGFVEFNVTNILKEDVEMGTPTYGFLLTVEPVRGLGLPATDAARFTDVASGELVVQYRLVRDAARAGRR